MVLGGAVVVVVWGDGEAWDVEGFGVGKYCDMNWVLIPSSSNLRRSESKEIVSSCFFKELSWLVIFV